MSDAVTLATIAFLAVGFLFLACVVNRLADLMTENKNAILRLEGQLFKQQPRSEGRNE